MDTYGTSNRPTSTRGATDSGDRNPRCRVFMIRSRLGQWPFEDLVILTDVIDLAVAEDLSAEMIERALNLFRRAIRCSTTTSAMPLPRLIAPKRVGGPNTGPVTDGRRIESRLGFTRPEGSETSEVGPWIWDCGIKR
jgi:hypothetical protein